MALRRDVRPAAATAVLVTFAVATRLYHLGLPHRRDFDEGVYWESLRLMQAGHALYAEIYFSQPPLFLASAYPFFEVFGRSIEAARLGCVFFSLAGLVGAWLCGRAIAGRAGAVTSLALAVTSAAYLQMSQTLQAEASAVGLSWLAVGLALSAREVAPARRRFLIAGAGIAFAFALCCKLLAVGAIVPIALSLSSSSPAKNADERHRGSLAAETFSAAFVLTVFVAVLPFSGALPAMLAQVIFLHAGSGAGLGSALGPNIAVLRDAFATTSLTLGATLGLILAILAKSRAAVLPVAWLASNVVVLALLTPLFPHHAVVLIPPLVALTLLAFAPSGASARVYGNRVRIGSIAVTAGVVVLGAIGCITYLTRDARLQSIPDTLAMNDAVNAVRTSVARGASVVTDDDFVVASADRDTPPNLVDTSFARIRAGQLSSAELIAGTAASGNGGVLLFTDRLATLPGFRVWLASHATLRATFGARRELWIPNAGEAK